MSHQKDTNCSDHREIYQAAQLHQLDAQARLSRMFGVAKEQPTTLPVHTADDFSAAFTTAEWEETGGANRVNTSGG
jgi:hypothetical protein